MQRGLLLMCFAIAACGSHGNGSPDGGQHTLAPAGAATLSGPVDGITCDTHEQLLFHIHAHLDLFVDGEQELLPAGIGIGPPLQLQNGFVVGGSCFSWLHTHDQTGIIHIESPLQRTFTLGDFFGVWGQPLASSAAGPAQGTVTAFADGQPYPADPSTMPLNNHGLLQLDVGTPVVPAAPYTFPAGY